MAHPEQRAFCERAKALHSSFFKDRRVLDVGSLDINGNNRFLFDGGTYTGIDVGPGPNVDVVALAHEIDGPFDVVISTECFEHDVHYVKSIQNIVRILANGGLFLFTCATMGRPEHGTTRTNKKDCPLLTSDYYKNLTEQDIRIAVDVDVDAVFEKYAFEIGHSTHDLYFWGIKR